MGKVKHIAHGRDHGGCLNGPNAWDGGEYFALTRLLGAFADLDIELLNMLLQHTEFSNELALLQDQAPLARDLFGANTLAGQLLKLLQLAQGGAALGPALQPELRKELSPGPVV
jgi:hypothetical protein